MTHFKKRLVIFVSLGFLWQSYGQEKLQYNGPLTVGDYTGQGTFDYVINLKDTVYDGAFQLQNSNLGNLLSTEDTSFLLDGNFKNGMPNGNWHFQFGEFQSESESKLVGYEYRVLISGRQEDAKGELINGKPNGKWVYTIDQIKSSEVEKNLFKSTINFERGIPQQNFQIENDSTVLVGRFLRNGLAHDEWSSYKSEDIENTENWIFEDGFLKTISLRQNDVTIKIPVFNKKLGSSRTVNLNQGYLELIKATVGEKASGLENGVSELLNQNFKYYQKINNILKQLGPSNFSPEIKVKVPHYPLDSTQISEVNEIVEDYLLAKAISDTLLNNSHLNIVKRSDKDAQFKFQVVNRITKDFLKPLETFSIYKNEEILEYFELTSLVKRLWPNGKPNKTIEVVVDSNQTTQSFVFDKADTFSFEGFDTKTLLALANYAKLSLKDIKESLSDRLTNEARLQALNGLEKDLIAENDSLVAKVDSILPKLSTKYNAPLKRIKSLADNSLSEYASLKNPEEKLAFGNVLKKCLVDLHQLTDLLGHLPEKSTEIKALYQDSVWNPFMATVMEEDVKKRITTAYSEILIPYFLKSANEVSCEKAKKIAEQIEHTNKRMVELREVDTKKLERKLRREKNAEEVIKLLHEQSTAKESKHEK
ncbi:hypothetical protein [Pseudozobellia sp. WGM2]|uniref:hypothetical protein n=1 Tax=Pseudozobellia sp. WGM2 TaxID=2787625 RepID=UPI001ADF8D07|nr:hypothetical protein [Pseudozobellia sp. WGM2]